MVHEVINDCEIKVNITIKVNEMSNNNILVRDVIIGYIWFF